jgi:hypothetical protein
MPRDSAGNTSFTSGVPVTGGTNISSAVFNALMADVYAMVQDSLSRSGKGGLLGPLKFADGSAAAPSIAFTEEGASGLHRAGANDHRYSIAGADVLKLLATGAYAAIFGPLTATSAVLKGAVADGASAVGTVLDNSVALANAGAKLASFRNAGVEKAHVDKDGNAFVAGVQASSGNLNGGTGVSVSITSQLADGPTSVGTAIDTTAAYSDAGAKLVSIRNDGAEKAYFDKDGKLFVAGTQVAPAPVLTDTPVAGSGWTVTAHSVKKNSDGLVTCHLKLAAGASPAAFQGAQLSAGFRPPVNSTIIWWNDTDGTETSGTLNSTGWVAPPNTANKTFSIHVSFYAA